MILDLQRFVAAERPHWNALEAELSRLEIHPGRKMSLEELRRFHYLYERTSADLAKLATGSSEPDTRRYLESLVARAYGEIHETRESRRRFAPLHWFFHTLPQTFRRHLRAFCLSVAITLAGTFFGGLAVAFDPETKSAVLPEMFAGHRGDPSTRVRREETDTRSPGAGQLAGFSAELMANNIGVSIKALALGMTFGLGTVIVLFQNGVILGVVGWDYVMAGQTTFLLAWLLPHGAIEIPAILIAGQAGLVIGSALIGWGQRARLAARFRAIASDLVTLIGGVAVMLVWAGIVEAFFSQFHAPVLPYPVKIAFGSLELGLLVLFLTRAGVEKSPDPA